MNQRTSVVEALIVFMMVIFSLLILEITLGTALDNIGVKLNQSPLPPMSNQYKTILADILSMFKQVHLVVGILVLAFAVWVVRVVIFGADYTRTRRGF